MFIYFIFLYIIFWNDNNIMALHVHSKHCFSLDYGDIMSKAIMEKHLFFSEIIQGSFFLSCFLQVAVAEQ